MNKTPLIKINILLSLLTSKLKMFAVYLNSDSHPPMRQTILLLFIISFQPLFSQVAVDTTFIRRQVNAVRTLTPPKCDGKVDEGVWKSATAVSDFMQNSPTEGLPATFQTEVRVLYDDVAIYVSAICHDPHPDSIMRQLGVRDSWVNADNFRVVFDTYNTQQDAFDFTVTASGVQSDSRFSDFNYNTVWRSEVHIGDFGWSVEMAIPWSALRFPPGSGHIWGIQFTRNIRRLQEFDQWALTKKGQNNAMRFWGTLMGLDNIQVPLRLSFTPYTTLIWQKDERFGPDDPAFSFAGGMDLKYGINEGFTLDMTLLPDFSQVQSDNVVKILGAFEQRFQEQRPFFTEGVDLFQLGDLFYSRRIGKTPSNFYGATNELDSAEQLIRNPTQSKLLNATKVSGRTANGLGIGLLNAFQDDTYAEALDTISGNRRKILTEPRSNYNIIVFQKQIKNSSSVYFINTNVARYRGWQSANVTGIGTILNDKKQNWQLTFDGALSDLLQPTNNNSEKKYDATIGYQYYVQLARVSGKLQYGINRQVKSRDFDANDMGITFETNYADNGGYIGYNIFNPWWILNQANFNISTNYQYNLITKEMNQFGVFLNTWMQFRKFSSMYFGIETSPVDSRDYYEPREQGRFFLRRRSVGTWGGYNTNSNKKLSGGFNIYFGTTDRITATIPKNPWIGGGFYVDWRANDRFTLSLFPSTHNDIGDRGWVNTEDDGTIVFGRRIIRNFENGIALSYVFIRDMSLTLNGRHYLATGKYVGYYALQQDGQLMDYPIYTGNHDFSYNSFNIDLVYRWIFAPGSIISIAWKQNILTDQNQVDYSYYNNLKNTLAAPQLNQVSVRILYFLDYLYIKQALRPHQPKQTVFQDSGAKRHIMGLHSSRSVSPYLDFMH